MSDDVLPSVDPGAVQEPTSPDVVAVPSTPEPPVVDPKVAELQQRLDKFETDMAALRSVKDRELNDLRAEAERREADYQARIRELEMATLDDEGRKLYETKITAQQVNELRQQNAALQARLHDEQLARQWVQYFENLGVPRDRIQTGNAEEVYMSGMAFIEQRLKTSGQPPTSVPGTPEKKAPAVATVTKGGAPKPDWPSLVKQYGSEERVYELIQSGQLSPEVIPVYE
jgi:hypothetical protein